MKGLKNSYGWAFIAALDLSDVISREK